MSIQPPRGLTSETVLFRKSTDDLTIIKMRSVYVSIYVGAISIYNQMSTAIMEFSPHPAVNLRLSGDSQPLALQIFWNIQGCSDT